MFLTDSLRDYRNSVNEANTFISIAFQQDSKGVYLLPPNQRNFIIDSAFIKIFIAWETFLESCVINYMLGEPSILENNITCYVQPLDTQHAHKILIGTQKYVDWSNPEIIRRLCNLFFEPGNPFDNYIASINTDLFDLKTIRNAAAHLTSTTSQQLDSLATRKLKKPCNNILVSTFIFSIDPESISSDSILTTYITKLDIAAEGIANG